MYEYNGGGVCHAYEKLGYGVDMWGGQSIYRIAAEGLATGDVMGGGVLLFLESIIKH